MGVATVSAVGLVQTAGAAGTGTASVLIPITPCRLIDTRAGGDNVGTRATPIGSGEAATFQVTGTNGNCTIPATATGIVTNATAVNPSSSSYITIYPADASPRPTASNLNFTAGAAPTPNQVTTGLSVAGAIGIYNLGGTVDIIVDIAGYYTAAASGGTGATGATGPQGPAGPRCPAEGCIEFYTAIDVTLETGAAPNLRKDCIYFPDGVDGLVFLRLPYGATITSVRVNYQDLSLGQGGGSTGYALQSVNETFSAAPVNQSAQFFTPQDGSAAITPVTLALNGGRPVQGRNTRYLLNINVSGATQRFCGAELTYTF